MPRIPRQAKKKAKKMPPLPASLILIKFGKLLTLDTDYEVSSPNKIRILKPARIGDEFQILDLQGGTKEVRVVELTRADATGVVGDLVQPADAVEWS